MGGGHTRLKITYNIYTKSVLEYDSEVIATANKVNLDEPKKQQSTKVCGAVKTPAVTALQRYTGNLPINTRNAKTSSCFPH